MSFEAVIPDEIIKIFFQDAFFMVKYSWRQLTEQYYFVGKEDVL